MTAEAKFSADHPRRPALCRHAHGASRSSNPHYLSPLFEDPFKGKLILLTVDVVMYSTGVLIMRDMTNVEV